jgi:uncharacterized protein YecT (DUF1311 family)
MFSHFALTEVSPTIAHANTQADTGSQLVLRVMKVIVVCLPVFWSSQLLAMTDEDLSKEFSVCMDKAVEGATADMFECIGDELDRQDARLNDNYKKLMSKLSRDRKKALLKAQRAWIKFRDANCDFYLDPAGGSADRLLSSDCRGGPGCLNRFSASISGASAGVRLPCGGAAW